MPHLVNCESWNPVALFQLFKGTSALKLCWNNWNGTFLWQLAYSFIWLILSSNTFKFRHDFVPTKVAETILMLSKPHFSWQKKHCFTMRDGVIAFLLSSRDVTYNSEEARQPLCSDSHPTNLGCVAKFQLGSQGHLLPLCTYHGWSHSCKMPPH